MDGCDLEMAFLSGPVGSAGCDGRGTAEESRRQEKKKARRCRGPQANYLNQGWNMVGAVDTDPDRPAQKKMDSVPSLNPATGMTVHEPVTQQYNYDTFVGNMDSLPQIRSNVEGPDSLQKNKIPSFFGASVEDSEPSFSKKKGLTEAFTGDVAPFVNVIGNEESYKLLPDFGTAFGKASATATATPSGPSPVSQETAYLTPTSMLPNSILPVPNVDVFWKENGLAGGQSSFFSQLKAPGGQPAGSAVDQNAAEDVPASRREVLTKLDKIFARLDDMDAAKSENAQTEVLLFILTGIGVIFLMDVGCKAAMSMARRR
jgi:hypothetical protein